MRRNGRRRNGMNEKTFRPSSKYLGKLYLNMFIVVFSIAVAGGLFGWLISLDEGARTGWNVAAVIVGLDAAWWLVGMMLAGPYFRSLRYEIQDDEVVVHVGIWTKSVKHVPYRTVTNITIKRDIFDRWFFGIGSLNIQTAGMSGTKGAEERLVGLPNVQEVYEIVVGELRRFRGGMSPTTAEVEPKSAEDSHRILNAILSELRSIRQGMAK
jgi:membrane protein YdbS with pleckstrin-like domain